MPLSGLLAVSNVGWPAIFYVFGTLGTVWCVLFLLWVYEDPEVNPKIHPEERMYIQKTLGRVAGQTVGKCVGRARGLIKWGFRRRPFRGSPL